jgi:hypothetical protein
MMRTFDVTDSLAVKLALGTVATVAAVVVFAGMLTIGSRETQATQAFQRQTGAPCGQCHSNPAGGGKLTSSGQQFKANGFKLKK